MAGRKAKWEELQLFERYSELSAPFFTFLLEMFNSDDKTDRKWAAERIEKAYIKMIPQDVTSGGDKIQPLLVKFIDGSEQDNRDSG